MPSMRDLPTSHRKYLVCACVSGLTTSLNTCSL